MQVSTYVKTSNYDILTAHCPRGKTVPQFMADIIREKCESFENGDEKND